MTIDRATLEHPTWLTLGGTLAGYLAILLVLTVLLFVLPWALFAAL